MARVERFCNVCERKQMQMQAVRWQPVGTVTVVDEVSRAAYWVHEGKASHELDRLLRLAAAIECRPPPPPKETAAPLHWPIHLATFTRIGGATVMNRDERRARPGGCGCHPHLRLLGGGELPLKPQSDARLRKCAISGPRV